VLLGMSASDTAHQGVVIYRTLHNDMGGTPVCELSRTERGMVRCLDQAQNVVLSECVAAAAAGSEVAAEWKARMLEKGHYFERSRPVASADFKTTTSRTTNAHRTSR